MSTSIKVFLLVTMPSRSILMSYASQIHRMRMQGRNGRKLQYKKRGMMLYCSFLYDGEVSFWLSRSPCWLKWTLYIYCCLTIGHRTRRNTRPRNYSTQRYIPFLIQFRSDWHFTQPKDSRPFTSTGLCAACLLPSASMPRCPCHNDKLGTSPSKDNTCS